MIELKKQNIIPPIVQRLMDSDCNCCMNCVSFKLFKGVKTFKQEDYKNLRARCSNKEAIIEIGYRKRPVSLNIFINGKVKIPKSRINCKFFELA